MRKNKIQWVFGIILTLVSTQAYSQVSFAEITVNLNYPQYQKLKNDEGYVYIEGGMKGIIIYHEGENSYIAYERACPHHPTSNCEVQVDGSSLFFIDHCCNSTFSLFNGSPTGGPAQRSLFQYHTELSGTTLKISDEIIN